MRSPNEDPPLCAFCRKQPATKKHIYGTPNEMVCAACFEQQTVQDVFQYRMRHVFELEHSGKVDEALARLNELLEADRDRDHDGWLARSVAHHRAEILLDAERYVEAEQAYRAWAEVGFLDVWRRRMHALGLARTLEALGRDREAVATLEDALHHDDPNDVPFAMRLLAELARISEKLALPVDPKWLRLAEAVAACYEVDMPVKGSPSEAILALEEIVGEMQPKRPAE